MNGRHTGGALRRTGGEEQVRVGVSGLGEGGRCGADDRRGA